MKTNSKETIENSLTDLTIEINNSTDLTNEEKTILLCGKDETAVSVEFKKEDTKIIWIVYGLGDPIQSENRLPLKS